MAWLLRGCILVFFGYVTRIVTSDPTPSEEYPHFVILDSRSSNVLLYWRLEGAFITFEETVKEPFVLRVKPRPATCPVHTVEASHFSFKGQVEKLLGNTTGWMGMGISPSGGMIGADIYVGWVKDGVPTITDRHGGFENTFPSMDEDQNLELLGGGEDEGWSRIQFRRQLASCEEGVDLTITTSTLRIIWALGTTDPEVDDIMPEDYHGALNRGVRSVLLLETTGVPPGLEQEENTENFDVLAGEIAIPAQETFYNCRYFELPKVPAKRHIIRLEPIIQAGNEDIVHHIILYECRRPPRDRSNIGRSHECYVRNMPDDFRACELTTHGWAIGGGIFYYPEHAGLPLGTPDSPRYLMMETHYDNPALRAGRTDNSGMRLVYTANLRQFDSGIVGIGHKVFPFLMIPPNAESFTITGECSSRCLSQGMDFANTTELHIFSGLLHSHLLGKKMRIRHFSANGTTEYPFVAEDNSYDFNYQEFKRFPQEVVFRRGESLQMVCDYDSTTRNNFTIGGLATQDEMCLGFIAYYPRIPVAKCHSLRSFRTMFGYFNVSTFRIATPEPAYINLDNVLVRGPANLAGQSLGSIANGMEWDEARIAEFQQYTISALPLINDCEGNIDLTNQFPGAPPSVVEPYQTPAPVCIEPTTSPPITMTSSARFLRGSYLVVISAIISTAIF